MSNTADFQGRAPAPDTYIHSPDLDQPFRNQPTVHIGRSALGYPSVEPALAERDYSLQVDHIREQLLALEQNTEGIDLARIDAYRRRIGAPLKPVLFLDPDIYVEAKTIAGSSNDDQENYGTYFGNPDVVIVKRDPRYEALNGPEWAESMGIHEIAHSSATIHPVIFKPYRKGRIFKRTEYEAGRSRVGFAVDTQAADGSTDRIGTFLEEAYAEYERGQYVKQLGNKGGAITENPVLVQSLQRLSGLKHGIGLHYWYLGPSENGGSGATNPLRSSFPAATLELLIDKDPKLLDALRASRHSATGLREVARRVSAIQPGLYRRLQATEASTSLESIANMATIHTRLMEQLSGADQRA